MSGPTRPIRLVLAGAPGAIWLKERWEQGLGLGVRAADVTPIEKGVTSVWVPDDGLASAPRDYQAGGLGIGSWTLNALIEWLAGQMTHTPGAVLIAEDYLARPSDPGPRTGVCSFVSDGHVFGFTRDIQAERIEALLRTTHAVFQLNVFVVESAPQLPSERGVVGPEVLDELALQIRAAAVAAFDGESYVVWEAGQQLADTPPHDASGESARSAILRQIDDAPAS